MCTSRRKFAGDALAKNEDEEDIRTKADSFLEGLSNLRIKCEEVLGFDEESGGEDEKADQTYFEKIEADNAETEKKCKQFLQKIKDV